MDENIDVRFKYSFDGTQYEVSTVNDMGWNGVKNGILLALASENQFDVFICVDKNPHYQQNLSALPLPVIVIDIHRNILSRLKDKLPELLSLLVEELERKIYIVK
ncbi:hypothetical protein [Persicitalea sp.]|uniref:hypothetical protein n=1 Tax=Persicitalea sp. TaxID=3100273 RepID=UPI003593583E